jgi:hypothetical protein
MKKIYTLLFVCSLLFSITEINAQQGTLVINEFDYDQPGTDSAEFIEIYNANPNAIDLGDYSILLINGNSNLAYDTIGLPSFLLAPNDYFVICGSYNYVPNCDMVLGLPSNLVQNGSPDAIALVNNSNFSIVDVVSYEGTVAAPFFETTGIPPGVSTSDSSLFNFVGLSRYPDGLDSNNNSMDFHLVCITPGMANTNDTANCLQPTALSELQTKSSVLVYPNPTKGLTTIDFKNLHSKNITIVVNNVLGKEVERIQLTGIENQYMLDLSEYQGGVYMVKVKSDTGESTQRIILRK